MCKPTYQLRIKPSNKAKCSVKRDQMYDRSSQLNDAVQWWENNKGQRRDQRKGQGRGKD